MNMQRSAVEGRPIVMFHHDIRSSLHVGYHFGWLKSGVKPGEIDRTNPKLSLLEQKEWSGCFHHPGERRGIFGPHADRDAPNMLVRYLTSEGNEDMTEIVASGLLRRVAKSIMLYPQAQYKLAWSEDPRCNDKSVPIRPVNLLLWSAQVMLCNEEEVWYVALNEHDDWNSSVVNLWENAIKLRDQGVYERSEGLDGRRRSGLKNDLRTMG